MHQDKPIVTEYQQHRLDCSRCGTSTTAPPAGDVPPGQAGPRLIATLAVLLAGCRQSKRRAAWLCENLFSIPCSTGWVVQLQNRATNEPAIALYCKLGFTEEGRRPHEVRLDDGSYVDDVLMFRFVTG